MGNIFQENEGFDDLVKQVESMTQLVVKAATSTPGYIERTIQSVEEAINDGILN